MNSATALMTSHVWPGVNTSNIVNPNSILEGTSVQKQGLCLLFQQHIPIDDLH
jgi:hypothetical protein